MRRTVTKPQEDRAKPFAEAVPPQKNIRQRKHDFVRLALSSAAEELFLARGFEQTTVDHIARAAGVSRRTFFRYYESKDDIVVERADRPGERLYAELAARPPAEPPLVAIRNALRPAMQVAIEDAGFVRWLIRVLREETDVRRAVLERRSRLEERIAALMSQRLRSEPGDTTPILLAFVTRALYDTSINAWYDRETDDIARLVDGLVDRLRAVVGRTVPTRVRRRAVVRRPPRRKP